MEVVSEDAVNTMRQHCSSQVASKIESWLSAVDFPQSTLEVLTACINDELHGLRHYVSVMLDVLAKQHDDETVRKIVVKINDLIASEAA